MKRFVFAVSMIISFLIFNCMVAFAEEQTPTFQEFDDYYYPIMGFHATQNAYNAFYGNVTDHPDWSICICRQSSPRRYYMYYGAGITKSGSTITLTNCYYNDSDSGDVTFYNSSYSFTEDSQNIFYENLEDWRSNFITIDFENVTYNPLIPTPKIQVLMLPYLTTALEAGEQYTFVQMLADDYQDYYIQVMAKYTVPDSIRIGSQNGQFTYDVISYADPQIQNVYNLGDFMQCQDISIGTYEDFWGWFPTTLPEVHYSVPAWENNPSNSIAQQAYDRWDDYFRNYMPLYGNQMEIYARLYLVDNGQIYCGAWRHWQSSAPTSFTEEIPDNYQPGYQLPGYENTDNNTEVSDGNTITNVGTPTGQNNSNTVIVNQNVPNYPDYPTAVSYNHDNILVQMITTAKKLPSFFSEFTSFLVVSFAFIPAEIWSIIGFGFLASIVVMIIKVL